MNLPAQVDTFLERSGGVAPATTLYVIEMGGNDIRDALVAYVRGGGSAGAAAILHDADASIASAIVRLYGAGARQFLVWRVPNIGLTPAIRALDSVSPGAAFLAGLLSQGFNAGLDDIVGQLSGFPGISITRLDAERILDDLVTHPAQFGLSNVTAPCVTPDVAPFVCDSPDEFLLWDGIHPTPAVHAILAQAAASALFE